MKLKQFLKAQAVDLTVFFGGALVMTYEIVGSRILAPYVGTSTYTWTSLIGVVLGALSLGYWIAGRMADRDPSPRILAGALFGAGIFVTFTVIGEDAVLPLITSGSFPLELKTVLAALLMFAPAAALMGFVVPYAVKLRTRSLDETGATVGRLYALSTVGSIIGTFAAGFFLIPFVGSTRTLYAVAAVLFGLAALLAPFSSSKQKSLAITLLVCAVGVNEGGNLLMSSAFNFHEEDTSYSRVRIFDTVKKQNGRKIRAMAIDPYIYQSSMYLDDGTPASSYHRYYHLIRWYVPNFDKVLMIGGAGYSFPKQFLRTYPNKQIDVVEIDPGMTALARKYFRLKDSPELKIFHEDGRVYLDEGVPGTYDAVLMDAFSTLFSIPYQLTTVESARAVKRILSEKGVVIFNIGAAAKGDASKFLGAELATYRRVFPVVKLFKVDPSKPEEEVQNFILVAFKSPPKASTGDSDPEIRKLAATEYDTRNVTEFPMLTDDLAPVEYYASFAQRRFMNDLR